MTPSLASLFNLAGPDLLIILFIMVMLCGVPIICLIVIAASRRKSSSLPEPRPSQPPPIPSMEDRLQRLDLLRRGGHISEVEYEEQRQRILNSI